jgi:hypothetical protein
MAKNEVAYRMIEANSEELTELEQQLLWIEELIKEQEQANGKKESNI